MLLGVAKVSFRSKGVFLRLFALNSHKFISMFNVIYQYSNYVHKKCNNTPKKVEK